MEPYYLDNILEPFFEKYPDVLTIGEDEYIENYMSNQEKKFLTHLLPDVDEVAIALMNKTVEYSDEELKYIWTETKPKFVPRRNEVVIGLFGDVKKQDFKLLSRILKPLRIVAPELRISFSDMVEDGNLIVREGLNIPSKYTYALRSDTADFSAKNIRVEGGAYYFDLVYPKGVCENVISGLPGIHNVENALAAFSIAYIQGLSVSGIVDSVASFSGVKRRFEYHIKTDNQIYIDDYAHHPKEIEVAIRSVRDLYPNKELTVVFQPHLFSRTRDFMDDFAKALSCADNVMLLDVYPARELPIDGVNSSVLLNKITIKSVS